MEDKLLSIIIPVHNEETILKDILHQLLNRLHEKIKFPYEVLFVENGSADNSLEVLNRIKAQYSNITVLSIKEANYGLALKEGMSKSNGDIMVNFDIDYWDIEFVSVVYALFDFPYDIIIGSKNSLLAKDKRPIIRQIVSQCFRFILLIIFGLRVSDTHGIKGWKKNDVLMNIINRSKATRHTFDTELILRAQRAGLRIIELPVEIVERRAGLRSIIKRIPEALIQVFLLRFRLIMYK